MLFSNFGALLGKSISLGGRILALLWLRVIERPIGNSRKSSKLSLELRSLRCGCS